MLAAHCNRALSTPSSWGPGGPLPFSDIHKTAPTFSKSPSDMSGSSSDYSEQDRSPASDLERSNPISHLYRQRPSSDHPDDPLRVDARCSSSPISPASKFGPPYDLPSDQKFLPAPHGDEKFHPVSFSEQKYHPGPVDDLKLARTSPASLDPHQQDSRLPITPPADQQDPSYHYHQYSYNNPPATTPTDSNKSLSPASSPAPDQTYQNYQTYLKVDGVDQDQHGVGV